MSVADYLEKEFTEEMSELENLEMGTDAYTSSINGATKLADRLITIQKNNDEYDTKIREIESNERVRMAEIEQNKDRKKLEWAKVIVPVVGAFSMGIITMIWEKTDTMTLTAGKSSWKDLISFRIK